MYLSGLAHWVQRCASSCMAWWKSWANARRQRRRLLTVADDHAHRGHMTLAFRSWRKLCLRRHTQITAVQSMMSRFSVSTYWGYWRQQLSLKRFVFALRRVICVDQERYVFNAWRGYTTRLSLHRAASSKFARDRLRQAFLQWALHWRQRQIISRVFAILYRLEIRSAMNTWASVCAKERYTIRLGESFRAKQQRSLLKRALSSWIRQ